MANFGEQPTSENRERISNNEKGAEDVKKQLQEAMESGDADKIIELGGQMKSLKGKKEEFIDQDRAEAEQENAEKDAEKMRRGELKEKGSETTMYEEAQVEDAAREKVKFSEDVKRQAEEDAKKAAEVLKKIQGTGGEGGKQKTAEHIDLENADSVAVENSEPTNKEVGQEKIENIYGMNLQDLKELIDNQGYPKEEIKANDPNFTEKINEFHNNQRLSGQARVKLFNRILEGKATEEEIKIAENFAAEKAKIFTNRYGQIHGIPKIWYTNERIASAIARTSKEGEEFVNNLLQRHSKEDLSRNYEAIDEDGFARQYERRQ